MKYALKRGEEADEDADKCFKIARCARKISMISLNDLTLKATQDAERRALRALRAARDLPAIPRDVAAGRALRADARATRHDVPRSAHVEEARQRSERGLRRDALARPPGAAPIIDFCSACFICNPFCTQMRIANGHFKQARKAARTLMSLDKNYFRQETKSLLELGSIILKII